MKDLMRKLLCKIGLHFYNKIIFAYGQDCDVIKIYFIQNCKYCSRENLQGSGYVNSKIQEN